jgi:Ras-related protein Rab-1A
MAATYDYLFKLLVVGDQGAGKSSLLIRWSDNVFTESFIATIGVDFKIKTISVNGKTVKLQVWDTAGGERFRVITSSYYRGANGVLLVCDLNDPNTVASLERWYDEVNQHANQNVQFVVVGCKSDVAPVDPQIKKQLEDFCEAHNITAPFFTSAKTGTNTDLPFDELAQSLLDAAALGPSPQLAIPKATEKPSNDDDDYDKPSESKKKKKKTGSGFFGLGKFM